MCLCRSLPEPGHTVLVEPVSFIFDTIELGTLIVCGLLALPHDPVHKSDARRRYYSCLADDANQMLFFLLTQDVRTIFLEGSAKIWVDKRMRTEFGQQSSHQFGHPHELFLFHMRGGVRFLGVSLG